MKYIIDTDPGIDDAIAIMLGIKNNLNIVGFTLASGNIPIDKSANNLMFIEDFLKTNIPIYKGKIINECKETAEYAHGKDGLGYVVFPPHKTRFIEKMTAEDFIIKTSKRCKNDLTMVCLGPLTNLANAIKKDPFLPKRIKHLVIMGATYDPDAKEPYLEFNVKIDPIAAKEVFNSSFEDIKVITHEIGIKSFIEKNYIVNLRNSEDLVSRFIGNISEKYLEFSYDHYQTEGLGTPDPTTIASIIDEKIVQYTPASIDVIIEGEKTGHCNVTIKEKSNLFISTAFDLERFRQLFKKTFN